MTAKNLFIIFALFFGLKSSQQSPQTLVPIEVLTAHVVPAAITVLQTQQQVKKTITAYCMTCKIFNESFQPYLNNTNLNEHLVNILCSKFNIAYKAHAASLVTQKFFDVWLTKHPWKSFSFENTFVIYLGNYNRNEYYDNNDLYPNLTENLLNSNINLHAPLTPEVDSKFTIFDAMLNYEIDAMHRNEKEFVIDKIRQLKRNGARINHNCAKYPTALIKAIDSNCWSQHKDTIDEVMHALIEEGANIDAPQKFFNNSTMLRIACLCNNLVITRGSLIFYFDKEVIEMLLHCGADSSIRYGENNITIEEELLDHLKQDSNSGILNFELIEKNLGVTLESYMLNERFLESMPITKILAIIKKYKNHPFLRCTKKRKIESGFKDNESIP